VAADTIVTTQLISLINNKSKRTSESLARTSMMATLARGNLTLVMIKNRTQVIQAIYQVVITIYQVAIAINKIRKTISYTNFVTKSLT